MCTDSACVNLEPITIFAKSQEEAQKIKDAMEVEMNKIKLPEASPQKYKRSRPTVQADEPAELPNTKDYDVRRKALEDRLKKIDEEDTELNRRIQRALEKIEKIEDKK